MGFIITFSYVDIKYSGHVHSHDLFLFLQLLFPSSSQTSFLMLHILLSVYVSMCVWCVCAYVCSGASTCVGTGQKRMSGVLGCHSAQSPCLSLHVELVIGETGWPASTGISVSALSGVLELGVEDNTQLLRVALNCGPQALAASTLICSIISSSPHPL